MRNEVAILFWGDYPTFLAPRFNFVFLKPDVLFREKHCQYNQVQQLYQPAAA